MSSQASSSSSMAYTHEGNTPSVFAQSPNNGAVSSSPSPPLVNQQAVAVEEQKSKANNVEEVELGGVAKPSVPLNTNNTNKIDENASNVSQPVPSSNVNQPLGGGPKARGEGEPSPSKSSNANDQATSLVPVAVGSSSPSSSGALVAPIAPAALSNRRGSNPLIDDVTLDGTGRSASVDDIGVTIHYDVTTPKSATLPPANPNGNGNANSPSDVSSLPGSVPENKSSGAPTIMVHNKGMPKKVDADADIEQICLQCSDKPQEWNLDTMCVTLNGISDEERKARLEYFGINQLTTSVRDPWYKFLWRSLNHPFNWLLLALAAAAGGTQDWRTMTVLCLMVFVSVLLRFQQELKAAINAESLKKQIRQLVRVRRPLPALVLTSPEQNANHHEGNANGGPTVPVVAAIVNNGMGTQNAPAPFTVEEVPFEQIVPGDVIELQAGSILPGDMRLLRVQHMMVNQSMLTGESLPVEKKSLTAIEEAAQIAESNNDESKRVRRANDQDEAGTKDYTRRSNLAFMGAVVESGSGLGLILMTGGRSYLGRNTKMLIHKRAPSSFAIGVKQVSYTLMKFMGVMVPTVIIISGLVQGDWVQAALFGLSVGVGLTPEMMPMIVNTNLSLGASVMAKQKAVVKRLEAIQNIGATTVLCTDKTGTLTCDRVSVRSMIDTLGKDSTMSAQVAILIANSQTGFKNVLDNAIIRYGNEHFDVSISPHNLITELPFDFKRRRMSIAIQWNATREVYLYSKGSAEELLTECINERVMDLPNGVIQDVVISPDRMQSLHTLLAQLSEQGLRVLALAQRQLNPGITAKDITCNHEHDLTLIGFVTFLDPPKPDAGVVLKELQDLNVAIKVVTGDHLLVAKKVCNELGLNVDGKTLTGDEMAALGVDIEDPTLRARVDKTVLFARLNPIQKATVVAVLKELGHTVAFLGDGLNDALALREADVGISVESASNLAKDAADIVLTEKQLSILKNAVVTGRTIHGNTIKYIKMTASSSFGNMFSVVVAACWLPFLPMAPIHLLSLNMIYDLSQTAIPWDRMDQEYLRTPHSWSASGLGTFMACIGPVSSIFDIATFAFAWFVLGYDKDATDEEIQQFQTCWFLESLLTQIFIVHMIRTEKIPFFQSWAGRPILVMTVVMSGVGFLIACTPGINDFFDMRLPPWQFWPWLFSCTFMYMVLSQLAKRLYIRVRKEWL